MEQKSKLIKKIKINETKYKNNTWIHMNSHEHPWTPMNTHEHPWTPMNTHEFTWIHMNSYEFPWIHIDFHEFIWISRFFFNVFCLCFFVYKTKRKTIFVVILYLLMVVNLFYTYICLLCNYSLLGFHLLKLCFTCWCLNEISVVQPFFHKFITFFGVFLWLLFVWMLFFWLFFLWLLFV